MASHFPSQHASWSGRGHSAGETCPFQSGFCSPPSSFLNQSTLHPLPHSNNFSFFFFLNPHCLLFTRLKQNSLCDPFEKNHHQNSLFPGTGVINSGLLVVRRPWIYIKILIWKPLFCPSVFPNIAKTAISLKALCVLKCVCVLHHLADVFFSRNKNQSHLWCVAA